MPDKYRDEPHQMVYVFGKNVEDMTREELVRAVRLLAASQHRLLDTAKAERKFYRDLHEGDKRRRA